MAQRGIREHQAKALIARHWETYFPSHSTDIKSVLVHNTKELDEQIASNPWLMSTSLVVKPDMLFGKRGKNNLVFYKDKAPGDVNINLAKTWIDEKDLSETVLICGTKGKLSSFIIEPFIPHAANEEFYIAASMEQDADVLYISDQGGVDIETNWDNVIKITVPFNTDSEKITSIIDTHIPQDYRNRDSLKAFAIGFYRFFKDMHFAYLELNPFVLREKSVFILDVVAKIDDTAHFFMQEKWGELEFPTPFGMPQSTPEELMIRKMDENSGASLKLNILNPKGLIWTLVAGGGASVVYADCIAQFWGAEEMANYGEYSGNPTRDETFQYASCVIDLMTRQADPNGREKILLIGGSIANFTDVAKTFEGIILAFEKWHEKMKEIGVKIYVRRGGPNYEIGLKNIELSAQRLGLSIKVFGPESHVTDIIRLSQIESQQERSLT